MKAPDGRRLGIFAALLLTALSLPEPARLAAQAGAHERSVPAQAMDPEFAAFVKQATTKPEFLSPLVDHLPVRAGVPTPKQILGYHIGTEKKLTYTVDQFRFFRELEKTLPGRVKTLTIGHTEEGRDIVLMMLLVGVIFVGFALLADLWNWRSRKRHNARH